MWCRVVAAGVLSVVARYEVNSRGFSLSGEHYYRRFRDIALRMVNDYKVGLSVPSVRLPIHEHEHEQQHVVGPHSIHVWSCVEEWSGVEWSGSGVEWKWKWKWSGSGVEVAWSCVKLS